MKVCHCGGIDFCETYGRMCIILTCQDCGTSLSDTAHDALPDLEEDE